MKRQNPVDTRTAAIAVIGVAAIGAGVYFALKGRGGNDYTTGSIRFDDWDVPLLQEVSPGQAVAVNVSWTNLSDAPVSPSFRVPIRRASDSWIRDGDAEWVQVGLAQPGESVVSTLTQIIPPDWTNTTVDIRLDMKGNPTNPLITQLGAYYTRAGGGVFKPSVIGWDAPYLMRVDPGQAVRVNVTWRNGTTVPGATRMRTPIRRRSVLTDWIYDNEADWRPTQTVAPGETVITEMAVIIPPDWGAYLTITIRLDVDGLGDFVLTQEQAYQTFPVDDQPVSVSNLVLTYGSVPGGAF